MTTRMPSLKPMPVSILIVEHFPVVRAGIRRWLTATPDFAITGETPSAEEGLRMVEQLRPDLLLLDLVALRRFGYERLPAFRANQPLLPVILLNSRSENFHGMEMMCSSVNGYFPSDGDADELITAIRTVCSGKRHAVSAQRHGNEHAAMRHQRLSARELQVFHSMCRGERPTQTADRLSLSLSTVNRYRKLVCRKMGVDGVPGLIRYAIDQGIEVFPE
ncbi:response regulator transcription factor [uncultured Oxalicibacterium sp.]|uniref:response regulator n=1 Tax=uncultured Oxalicibacterium sp. TaxID=1168540 RepID=UPI0025F2E1E9|nr:response regulator transcription factor [uncultured Oxalicibacterium sp.]